MITITDKFTKVTGECGRTYRHVECICECGKIFVTQVSNARRAVSCGCLNPKNSSHKMTKTSTYKTWHSMRSRCLNKKHKRYNSYGGRGITICDRWEKFENFLEDMGNKPDGLSLDRINNDGNYCKDNCKWSTDKEQCRNRRNNVYLMIDGITQTMAEWEKCEGAFCRNTIYYRFTKGWSHKEAVFGKNK